MLKGQTTTTETAERVRFLSSIGGLSLEERADLLLTSTEQHHELLKFPVIQEQLRSLYDDAGRAQHPFIQDLLSKENVDSVESQSSFASKQQRLDTLSIKLRVISLTGPNDPRVSYKRFSSLSASPPPRSCSDASTYDPSAYYVVLGEQISIWRERDTVSQAEVIKLLEQNLVNLSSASALPSLASFLATAPLSENELLTLSDDLAAKQKTIELSNRELDQALILGGLIGDTSMLADRLEKSSINAQPLMLSLHDLLVNGTRSVCSDAVIKADVVISDYNNMLKKHHMSGPELALGAHAMDGEKISGAALHSTDPIGEEDVLIRTLARYWERFDTSPVLEDMASWDNASAALLHSIEYVPEDIDCNLCRTYNRSLRYLLLINYSADLPLSSAKENAMRSFVRFLSASSASSEDQIAWISQFKALMNLSRPEDDASKAKISEFKAKGYHLMGLPSSSGKAVLAELRNSREPRIAAYARYEHLFQPSFISPF